MCYKKVVLENFAILTGKQVGFPFNKVASLQDRNFFKKRDSNTGVSCGYCEIFKTLFLRPILKNICERLLPDYFYGSLIHRPNGLRSIFYDSVRLQGPSPWPSYLFIYLFIYFALVLNRVPIRVRKSKTNTFDESINPAGIYLLKVNNRNTRARCEICSKLTIKTPKRGQQIVYFSSF